MSTFVELSDNEILSIDGGTSKFGYASTAFAAYEASSVCFSAITVAAPALATAGLVTGGLVFGVIAVICIGGFIFG